MSDKEMNNEQVRIKERPVKTFRAGAVSSAVLRHTVADDDGQEKDVWSVTLDKRYRGKVGGWKSSKSMSVNDIPKAILVLQRAYGYIVSDAKDDDNLPF